MLKTNGVGDGVTASNCSRLVGAVAVLVFRYVPSANARISRILRIINGDRKPFFTSL